MKKIPTLFLREEVSRNKALARNEVNQECAWVLAGEGCATRKWDGTCCLVRGGKLYKRLEWDVKNGAPPTTWLHHDFDPSATSGHGWVLVGDGPEDWMHRAALARAVDDRGDELRDGSYELIGPRIGKNPECVSECVLVPHGRDVLLFAPRTFSGIRQHLQEAQMEGIVWHHHDGRMAKIKRRDFGIQWPVRCNALRPPT